MSPRPAGFALPAVLVVMVAALLVATSLLFLTQSEMAAGARAAHRVRAEALAWSGVQAAMTSLDRQRDEILQGRRPRLEAQLELWELDLRLGVARLLPLGPAGERLVPEAGKLDLNGVGADVLAATGLVDEQTARAIVEHREAARGRPYQSVAELLEVPGITVEDLWGPLEELGPAVGGFETPDTPGVGAAGRVPPAGPRGLADVVTVYAFEPAIQRNGRLRINLNVPWSDDLGRRVARRFGDGAAQTLQRIFESGTTFDDESRIFEVLRFFQVPPESWPEIIDAFTTEDGEFHFGRLDINTAPHEALAALPGLDADAAAAIVDLRDELPDDDRSTIAWPAAHGIVAPEAYDELAGRITTRCWTWRLRLAAGEVDAEAPDGPLLEPVVYDVVIDLGSPRPRIAYLRDVTWLAPAARLAAAEAAPPREPQPDEDPLRRGRFETAPGGGSPGGGQPAGQEPVGPEGPPAAAGASTAGRRRIGRWTAG